MGWCLSKERVVEGTEGEGLERERGKRRGKNKSNSCTRMLMKTAKFIKNFDRLLKILFISSLKKNEVLDLGIKFLKRSRQESGSLKWGKGLTCLFTFQLAF